MDETKLSHQERYNQWAPNYNKDVAARNYDGPEYIVNYLMELSDSDVIPFSPSTANGKILDVGCGSGLVGTALKMQDFRHIDGVDLSHGMIAEAHKTQAYQTLIGWCDLRKPLPFFLHKQYDLTVCCGVFALDFVEPTSLKWLTQVTQSGGTIVMSTKTTYFNDYDFQPYYQQLEQEGQLKLLDYRMNKPYLGTEADGHYWVFSVLDNAKIE